MRSVPAKVELLRASARAHSELWATWLLSLMFLSSRAGNAAHSRLNMILIRNQSLSMGPFKDDRALLGGLEFGFREILANGASQKKIKKLK